MDQDEKKMELIRNQVKLLLGSFDTVHIFCSKDDPLGKSTGVYNWGEGNYFARYGQIKIWILQEDESHKSINDE